MKKLLAVLLACAMFLPLLASCGSMQAGELDVEAYEQVGKVQNAGYTGSTTLGANGATVSKYDKNATVNAATWYASKEGNVLTIDSAAEFLSFVKALNTYEGAPKTVDNPGEGATPEEVAKYEAYLAAKEAWDARFSSYKESHAALFALKTPSAIPIYDFSGITVQLTVDLDMTGASGVQIAGNGNCYFNGIFDGQNHVIKGYKITATSNNRSIFGPLYDATIKDVAFLDACIDAYCESHQKYTKSQTDNIKKTSALLSVWCVGTCSVDNVLMDGEIIGGKANTAAIIGEVTNNTTLTVNNVSVNFATGKGQYAPDGCGIGGVIGRMTTGSKVTITNCDVVCDITVINTLLPQATAMIDLVNNATGEEGADGKADLDADGRSMYSVKSWCAVASTENTVDGFGGIVGRAENPDTLTIDNCSVSGSLDVAGAGVGGILGYIANAGSNVVVISNCENNADINNGTTVGVVAHASRAYYNPANNYKPYSYAIASAYSKGIGGIVGQKHASGNIQVISCTNNGDISVPETPQVGGIVGLKGNTSDNSFVFADCINTGDIQGNSQVGGLVGALNQTSKGSAQVTINGKVYQNNTISNSHNSGNVTSSGSYIGGLVGHSGCTNGLTITGSNNTGDLKGASYVGGIIGRGADGATDGKLTVSSCNNYGDVIATGECVSGIVAYYQGTSVEISKCQNHGDVLWSYAGTSAGGRFLGGVAGYLVGASSDVIDNVVISECVSTGAITANRASGGLVGFIQHSTKTTITDCTVSSKMTFNLYDTGNRHCGGLAGKITETKTATVSGCVVTGAITLSDKNTTSETSYTNYAAGLVGDFRNDTKNTGYAYSFSNCLISVDFTLHKVGTDHLNLVYGVDSTNNSGKLAITWSNIKYVAIDSDYNTGGADITALGENLEKVTKRTIKAVGQQYKYDEATDTYALRYVFGVSDLSDLDKAIGFDVTVDMADGSKRELTVYCPTLYTSIRGEGDVVYNATDETIAVDYLFTLTIAGIPADQITKNGDYVYMKDAIVNVDSFTSYNEYAKLSDVSVKSGDANAYGNKHELNADNFSDGGAKYEALDGKDVITVEFATAEQNAASVSPDSNGTNLYTWMDYGTATAHGIKKLKAATTGGVYHYYFHKPADLAKQNTNLYEAFIRLEVEVPADGEYTLYFRMRLKAEATTRYSVFAIDDAPASEQHYIKFSLTENEATNKGDGAYDASTNPDGTMGTYMNSGITLELTKGTHTITFRMPQKADGSGIEESSFHFRTLYLVPVA